MRGFRVGQYLAGALAALSMDFKMPVLPELKFSRKHPNYAPPRPRRRTTLHATNGKRECERRMRQIADGRLKAENGLVP